MFSELPTLFEHAGYFLNKETPALEHWNSQPAALSWNRAAIASPPVAEVEGKNARFKILCFICNLSCCTSSQDQLSRIGCGIAVKEQLETTMYSLSNSRRPREEDDADDRPQAPVRQPTNGLKAVRAEDKSKKPSHDSFAHYHDDNQEATRQAVRPHVSASAAKDGKRAARTKSSPQNSYDDEEKVEGSYAEVGDKGGKPTLDATTVGAVAVPGISAPNSPSISTNYEDAYEDSFTNRSPQAEVGQPVVPRQNEPVEARCVADDEADIEAQVQTRMKNEAKDIAEMVHKQLMANAAVADVQPSIQDTSSLTTTPSEDDRIRQKKKRKMLCLIAVGLLVIVGAIAAGVGVAVSRIGSPSTPPAEQCSFCFDGSTPSNLDTNEVLDQTCAEFSEKQIQLDSTDSNCGYGQTIAFAYCECPTLPPAPENPMCTLCENGATPLGDGCEAIGIAVAYLGEDPLNSCENIKAEGFAAGCTCPGESFNGSTIEAFQSVLESLSGDQLNDENSPQFEALNWIANDDPGNLSVGDTPTETISARYVAAVLYYAFKGDDWVEKYNFLSEGDICKWNHDDFGILCGSDGSVKTLRLCKFRRLNPPITLSYIRA